jgi:hypothetical protein
MAFDWTTLLTLVTTWGPRLLRHPLFVALFQLAAGGLVAYWLTERWQRWRQQRDFQYRAMVKFNELLYDIANKVAELLMARVLIGAGTPAPSYWDKYREFVSRRTALEAMRDELVAPPSALRPR